MKESYPEGFLRQIKGRRNRFCFKLNKQRVGVDAHFCG